MTFEDPLKGYFQKFQGTFKSGKPNNITAIDEIHFKCDCFDASFVKLIRELVLFSFALGKPTRQ